MSIEQFYEDYKAHCYPNGVTPVQDKVMKATWIAGSGHIWKTIGKMLEMPSEKRRKLIKEISDELDVLRLTWSEPEDTNN